MQAGQRSANGQTTEARLGDWAIDDSLLAEAVKKTLGNLVPIRNWTSAFESPELDHSFAVTVVAGRS